MTDDACSKILHIKRTPAQISSNASVLRPFAAAYGGSGGVTAAGTSKKQAPEFSAENFERQRPPRLRTTGSVATSKARGPLQRVWFCRKLRNDFRCGTRLNSKGSRLFNKKEEALPCSPKLGSFAPVSISCVYCKEITVVGTRWRPDTSHFNNCLKPRNSLTTCEIYPSRFIWISYRLRVRVHVVRLVLIQHIYVWSCLGRSMLSHSLLDSETTKGRLKEVFRGAWRLFRRRKNGSRRCLLVGGGVLDSPRRISSSFGVFTTRPLRCSTQAIRWSIPHRRRRR